MSAHGAFCAEFNRLPWWRGAGPFNVAPHAGVQRVSCGFNRNPTAPWMNSISSRSTPATFTPA